MKKKIILLALLVIISISFTFIALTIINSKDCDQLVIDTYEIHSGIDIPKVKTVNCYYDGERNTRLSIYLLKEILVENYLNKYEFEPIDSREISLSITLSENEKPNEQKLYAVSGTRWGNKWRYIVEKESHRLWVEIKYN